MKNLSLILSVILLVSCNPEKESKTILVKTSGFVEIAPDEASIILDANCVDMNIKQAKACLIDITSKLNDDLTNFGIQKEDILTTNVNLSKDYVWSNNSEVFNGYRASTTTRVKVRDLKILDELYSKLLSNEKLTIGSLSYSHSKMDSINGVASLRALENANYLADQILSQLPEKNKTITQVSNFEISKSEVQPERNAKMLEVSEQALDNTSITVNLGNLMAVQHLFVEFKIY
jgi:uncharacterized protein YggE